MKAYVGNPCIEKWKVPLVPLTCIVPMMISTVRVCDCIVIHVLYYPTHASRLSLPSISLSCSGYFFPSIFSSYTSIDDNLCWTLPGSVIKFMCVSSNFYAHLCDQGKSARRYFCVIFWIPLIYFGPSHTLISILSPLWIVLKIIQQRLHMFNIFWFFVEGVILIF